MPPQVQQAKPKVDCELAGLNLLDVPAEEQRGMNRGIYAAATGMMTNQRWMDVTANNMANVNTAGFKQDQLLFNDQLQNAVDSQGNSVGGMGSGPVPMSEFSDMTSGSITQTGNPLDVAIEGPGMFQVQAPNGVMYTRSGSFKISPTRELTTSDGLAVLDNAGRPIDLAKGEVAIDAEGNVMVDGKATAKLQIYSGSFKKEGANLFSAPDAQPKPDFVLHESSIEGSNVNVIQAMADLIKLGRNFELSQKSIQTQDDMTQKLIQSL